MGCLAEDHASTLFCLELLRAPRTIEEVGVIHRGYHAHLAVDAVFYECAGMEHGAVEAVAMPDNKMRAVILCGLNHPRALVQGYGHRLFHKNVFSVAQSQTDMVCVNL